MHTTRRVFLQAVTAGSTARGVGWAAGGPLQAAEAAALDAARKQAAHRKRRIIYNNDGDDVWARGANTAEKFLALRHEPLLGTQVDSVYYCTTQSFNLFTHDTRVAEVFLSREGPFADNNLQTFLDRRTDPLRMSCDFARKHHLESIWTLRMNDVHDAWTPQFVSRWKKADPRRVLSTLEKAKGFNDRRRLWSLVDFEHADVEPRLVAIIEEVLRNYPVDGVELDFLRAPFYFRTAYEGKPATERQRGLLTRLVRSIRQIVLRQSERQGKPFLLAARFPVTTALCLYVGIEIAAWLEEKLIDVLALGGGYVTFDQPMAPLIALAHRHDVPAYPCLSQSGLLYRPPRGQGEPMAPAAWNGAALRCWEAGADGIYVFNLFPGPGPQAQRDRAVAILKAIGSKEALALADRVFAVSDAGNYMPAHYWARDAEEFAGALPTSLDSRSATTIPLVVAGPVGREGRNAQTELRLDFTGLSGADVPAVRLNAQALGQPSRSETIAGVRRFHFAAPSGAARTGTNEIRVDALSDCVKLAGAELWIWTAKTGGWQEHRIRQGDGRGGWITRPAQRQVLKHPDTDFTMPFGLVRLDNGEIALLCSREKQPPRGAKTFEPVITFSADGGATWSDFRPVPGTKGRPQYLEALGVGRLSFITEVFDKGARPRRVFSNDYGRTWKESIEHPPTKEGRSFGVEGNAWIDRDEKGRVRAILELGWHYAPGKSHPKDDATVVFRRSVDGGKTWIDEVAPAPWKFTAEHAGRKWLRGVSEGAIVRAANGDLVAALRTDMPPRYFDGPHDDSLEGTAISISRDDGKTWLGLHFLFEAGRHHANLQRLPNGDIVCTLIVRDDIQGGRLVSHRRGCDALLSKDHGRTWNLDRRFELDRFEFLRKDGYWVDGMCGHVASVVLDDGHVLSAYGHYLLGAAVLIKWRPDAGPVQPLPPGKD